MLDCAQISLHPEGKVDGSLRGFVSAAVCVSLAAELGKCLSMLEVEDITHVPVYFCQCPKISRHSY